MSSRAIYVAFLVLAGCVSVSDVAVVSRTTALEEQAAGAHPDSDDALTRAALSPGPEPVDRASLAGAAEPLGVVAALYAAAATDADAIDAFLIAQCIGEALDGTLVTTPDACTTPVEPAELSRLIGRENLQRRQAWTFLEGQRPEASPEAVRAAWRETHLERVVCGALVETEGGWEPKACE
ncbi:MAG: hypothetical protein AAGH15_18220 [Myxococcota bacterium]